MARTANSMVTFQDLDDMVTFDGFSYVTNPITPPSNLNTCATKLDVLGYLNVTLNRSIANNQLVSYSIIVSSINTTAFIIEVDTTNSGSSNANQFQFTGAEGDYDVVAKQSGTTVATFNNLSNEETITLPSNGNYILEVTPKETNGFNKIRFNNGGDKLKITDIKQWGSIVWSSFNSAFFGCGNMLVTATNTPNLSNVTDMILMFCNALLANPNTSNWDVSNVTTMVNMFRNTSSANPNTSNWDVSNVENMTFMFGSASVANPDVSNWDVSNVTDMNNMFRNALAANPDASNWDVSQVTNMVGMFDGAESFNRDLSNWCVTNITSRPSFFDDNTDAWVLPNSRPVWGTCPGVVNPFIIEVDTTNSGSSNANQFQFTGVVGNYDVVAKQNVTVASFNNLSNEETITLPSNGIYILEVTPKVSNGFNRIRFANGGDKLKITDIKQWGDIVWSSFENAFFGCSNMEVNATDVPDLSNVTDMQLMFQGATSFNQPLNNWDVSSVTDMRLMFQGATSFNQPLNNWDVSNVNTMKFMFSSATSFNQSISSWNVSSVTDMGFMFRDATSFNQSISSWNVSSVTDMVFMFRDATSFNQPLDNWDVSQVTSMDNMFAFATSFNQPLNSWNVSSVTDMDNMFRDAESFNRDLSSWCVSNITSEPSDFDTGASDWILPNSRPVWGTCPGTDTNDFEISLDRVEYFNTNGKDYIFQRSDELFLSTPDFGNIVIVGTVRFEEIGAVSEPYTGNCEVLRTQDVSFSYDLSYPYDDDITVYVNSINPYSTTPNSGGCNTVDRLGSIKVNFDSFTNTPIISGNNKLTINNQVRDR